MALLCDCSSSERTKFTRCSDHARYSFRAREGKPLFLANWERVLFLHFEVPPKTLQPVVPFDLDLWNGRAFVSLVAFTMTRLCLRRGSALGRLLCAPLGHHPFLNVRTYVRHRDDAGIFFIAEWLPNRLAVALGPLLYGLPYRLGQIAYDHRHERGSLRGRVTRGKCGYAHSAVVPADAAFIECKRGSPDEFLLERYVAFTGNNQSRRCFRVWHEPWQAARLDVHVDDDSLLESVLPWWGATEFFNANYSPRAENIWMGRPHFIARGRTPKGIGRDAGIPAGRAPR